MCTGRLLNVGAEVTLPVLLLIAPLADDVMPNGSCTVVTGAVLKYDWMKPPIALMMSLNIREECSCMS